MPHSLSRVAAQARAEGAGEQGSEAVTQNSAQASSQASHLPYLRSIVILGSHSVFRGTLLVTRSQSTIYSRLRDQRVSFERTTDVEHIAPLLTSPLLNTMGCQLFARHARRHRLTLGKKGASACQETSRGPNPSKHNGAERHMCSAFGLTRSLKGGSSVLPRAVQNGMMPGQGTKGK